MEAALVKARRRSNASSDDLGTLPARPGVENEPALQRAVATTARRAGLIATLFEAQAGVAGRRHRLDALAADVDAL